MKTCLLIKEETGKNNNYELFSEDKNIEGNNLKSQVSYTLFWHVNMENKQ